MHLNKGAGQVAEQNIQYVGEGLKYVQSKLAFTDAKNSLIEYFQYQKINALKDDTNNKLLVGVTATLIQNDWDIIDTKWNSNESELI